MANPEDLGQFRLKRLLGRGALGQVWEATDRDQPGTKVAVKIMHAADEELTFARVQFAREARLASLLRHPHVVTVHDAGEAAGTSFMVMEMVDGPSLRKLMGDPAVTVLERLRWLRQIGDGIAAIHGAGIAHRDLKPENVIIRPDRTACIVDLGMAKWKKFDLGGEMDPVDLAEMLESPPPSASQLSRYVPPETTDSSIYDDLSDQYAWGVIAYELLTGTAATDDSPPLTAREGISVELAAAIERARSKERERRWPRMDALLENIDVGPTSAPIPRSPPRVSKPTAQSASTAATIPAGELKPERAETEAGRPETAQKAGGTPRPQLVVVGALAVLLVVVGLILAGLR